jgi:phosphoenolpyruvate carboxylase
MNTVNEKQYPHLIEELVEYEKNTHMTESERRALHKWVANGHSVHQNGFLRIDDCGIPLDFLDVYRYEKEIERDLKGLDSYEKKRGRVALSEEIIQKLQAQVDVYEKILCKYDLMNEANQQLQMQEIC